MDDYISRLKQQQEQLEGDVASLTQQVNDHVNTSAGFEADTAGQKLREDLQSKIEELEMLKTSIALYGGAYTVGSDGTTGLYFDRDGNAGPFAFNSPTIFNRNNGAITFGIDPQTGQSWTVWMQNHGLQDQTGLMFAVAAPL
jgi:hypothetical protein